MRKFCFQKLAVWLRIEVPREFARADAGGEGKKESNRRSLTAWATRVGGKEERRAESDVVEDGKAPDALARKLNDIHRLLLQTLPLLNEVEKNEN